VHTISAACAAALRTSHTRQVVLEVYDGFGPIIATTYGTPRLSVIDGEVQAERRADFTRRFRATVVDRDGAMVPAAEAPYLDPLRRPQVQVYFDVGWIDASGA